jgi:hypothetical protein
VRNANAVWAFLVALLALAVLVGGAAAAAVREEIGLYQAIGAVPAGGLLALLSLSLARRARWQHQRTLGRAGGAGLAATARYIGALALLVAITAALALAVFAVLLLALE